MMADAGSAFRRAFHIASPAFLVYYLLPADLWIGFSKVYLTLLLWSVTLVIEILRLAFDVDLIGLRDYERGQISAYFWGGTGLTIGLLLFPPPLVVVAMCGMAWIDPLCAWTREKGGYPVVPLISYGAVAAALLWALTGWSPVEVAMVAAVAAFMAVAAEYPTIKYIDDDFTMQIVPLLGMTLLWTLL
jgi:hypothetical protein